MAAARTAPAAGRSQRPRRTSGPARSRGGIRWDRVARFSLLVVLALIVASYVGPAANYIEAWKFSNQTKAELTQLQHENKRLKKRSRQLRDPTQIELEARRIGMAKPDQKVYVIKGLPRRNR